MDERLKAVSAALVNPLVALLIIGTVGAIAGLLAFSTNKRSLSLCIGVGLLGVVSILYLIRSLYNAYILTDILSASLREGQQLIARGTDMMMEDRMGVERARQDWCNQVEQTLKKKGEAYASRFHIAAHEVHDREYGIEKMRPRLNVLAEIVKELDSSRR